MADLYPNIRFPEIDFSAIADLPKTYEEGKLRQARQSLADAASGFDLNTSSGLTNAAKKAASVGLFPEAQQFLTQAHNLEGLKLKGVADAQYAKYLGMITSGKVGVPGAAPTSTAEPSYDLTPHPDMLKPAAPAAPVMQVPGMPAVAPPGGGTLGPRSEVIPIPPSLNAPPQREASATEQVLQAAEGAAPPQAPPMRLAGPPPTPDTGPVQLPEINVRPPGAASVPPPPQFPARGAAPVPFLPEGPVSSAPAPGPQRPVQRLTGTESEADLARQEAMQAGAELMKIPRQAAGSAPAQAFRAQFNHALDRLKLTPEEKSYQQELQLQREDNYQREQQGLPPEPTLTRLQFKTDESAAVGRIQRMEEHYSKNYYPKAQMAKDLADKLDQMGGILADPKFVPGPGAEADKDYGTTPTGIISEIGATVAKYASGSVAATDAARNKMASLAQNWTANGWISPEMAARITPDTKGPALRELFTSLANQAVTTALGGLSKSISDSDRLFLSSSYPALSQTKEGMKLIHEFLSKAAARAGLEAQTARDYYKQNPRGNLISMDQAVEDRLAATKKKSLLGQDNLGNRMQDAMRGR